MIFQLKGSVGAALALAVVLGLSDEIAWAQDSSGSVTPKSAAEVLEQIGSSSKDYDQLNAALNSPDQSVRMAAFDAMAQSNNPALIELAIATAHASADEAMQALAVRAAFKSVRVLHVELFTITNPETATESRADCYEGAATVSSISYTYETGAFVNEHHESYHGNVSGNSIGFVTKNCAGTLTAKEGSWEFVGPVDCSCGHVLGRFRLR